MDKIKVAIRARPLNKRELYLEACEAVEINGNQIVISNLPANKDGRRSTKTFTYDFCFDSSSEAKPNYVDQKTVYDNIGAEILENTFAGYNSCIFAYGQTGSGKSYTMMGTEENKGLVPLICESIFEKIKLIESDTCSIKVECYYMEIYNEKCRDLLNLSKQNLRVREHQILGAYVEGLSQLAVSSFKDIDVLIKEGNKSRTIAATNMNDESSRSHAVFRLKVSQSVVDKKSGISGEKVSQLSLVDLAGSEKVSKTGTDGDRLKEGCNINRSLLTLGIVISNLADNAQNKSKQKHIPYRDSILTWLLKDSLGGNSKTVMVATISTAYDNYEETLSTLRYADRAKRIVNNAVVNEDPNAKIIRNLREELEALKKELEMAKEKMSSDSLSDQLKEREILYKEMSKPWTEKLAESEKIQQELSNHLETMGICVQSSGISVEKNKIYLVNINPDPLMNELLVYYLKDLTLVGRADAKNKQDIQLFGPGIAQEHCAFYMKNNHVCLTPIKSAKTRVNGYLISEETVLHNGDRIELGVNHFFRINCPASEIQKDSMKHFKSLSDFKYAQEEVLLSKVISQYEVTDSGDSLYTNKSPQSSDSIDEHSVNLEYAVKKFEKNCTSNLKGFLSSSSSFSSLEDYMATQTRKGLKTLREQLISANSLAREANYICNELNERLKFSVTLRIPAKNLAPNRKRESLLSEPAIIIKKKFSTNNQTQNQNSMIDLDVFQEFMFGLRDLYTQMNLSSLITPEISRLTQVRLKGLLDDYEYNDNLIGVANLFLDSLFIETCILLQYDVPILNQQGEISGLLKIKLQRIDGFGTPEVYESKNEECVEKIFSQNIEAPEHQSIEQDIHRRIRFRLSIVEAVDLPVCLSSSVFCKYHFWTSSTPYIVPSRLSNNNINKSNCTIQFDYENEFSIDLSEEFIEYCLDGALSIQILGKRDDPASAGHLKISDTSMSNGPKKYAEAVQKYNQMIKYKGLIDSWNEVSKAIEMHIQILELNANGNWSPVEVKQEPENENMTGGVYQLRQGQSRQINIRINTTKPNSIMWYNGLLFNLEAYKIDRVLAGNVIGKESGVNQPLDSYQDIDLNNLRDKCKEILESRKHYLYSQLSLISSEVTNEEEKERYESLCKQLVSLGEEQAALDAPEDNSGLPGSTIEWEPAVGMEKHVPIIFLDIDQDETTSGSFEGITRHDLSGDLNTSDDYYEDDFESNQSSLMLGAGLTNKKWSSGCERHIICGKDCFLKDEQRDSRFVDLKLMRWNDSSSMVEMVACEEFKELANTDATSQSIEVSSGEDLNGLKAVVLWDSSIHQSALLNQVTPANKNVYLTIKVNLKLKILNGQNLGYSRSDSTGRYIDLTLRKRLAVNIVSANMNSSKKLGLFGLKSLLGGVSGNGQSTSAKSLSLINTTTSVVYRIIASVPRSLLEIESRESLAIQAATLLVNDSTEEQKGCDIIDNSGKFKSSQLNSDDFVDTSLTQFQYYAKTIAAVDSILKQDRIQQQMAIRSAINSIKQENLNSTSDNFHPFSVPRLLKTGFESIMNLSSFNTIQQQPQQYGKYSDFMSVNRLASMGTQLIDAAVSNNKSFKNLIDLQNISKSSNHSDNILEEMRQLEIEIEGAKRKKQEDNNFNEEMEENQHKKDEEIRYEDIPIIPTVKLVLPAFSAGSDFIHIKTDKQDEQQISNSSLITTANSEDLNDSGSCDKLSKMIQEIADIKTSINENFAIKSNDINQSNTDLNLKKCDTLDLLKVSMSTSLSNNSLASTLTNLSTKPDFSIETLPKWLVMDTHVIVSTNSIQNKRGYVRFIGATKFAHGTWIGVELEQPFGKNDGSLKGIRYFRCGEDKGCFVRADKLTMVVNKI